MSPLLALADALHLLGKAIDPQSVTKVRYEFEHTPTDIPGVTTSWAFKVTLLGTKGISEEGGDQEISFTQTWSGEGNSDVEAVHQAYQRVIDHLRDFQRLRRDEAQFAEQAVMTAMSAPTDLTNLWPSEDPSPAASPVQAPGAGQNSSA